MVPRDRIAADTGLILPTATSVLFVIPWKQHWIVGTTDTDWNLDLAHPAASARDVEYLLDTLNAVLTTPLTRDDIEGIYAGLRPLLAEEEDATSRLSREHAVSESVSGLITVAGGKYTTYRVMARDTIDLVASALPGKVPPCCTDRIPCSARTAGRAPGTGARSPPGRAACTWARWSTCSPDTARSRASCWMLIAGRPELGSALEGAPAYLAGGDRPRRLPRSRRCISRTC